MPTVTNNKARNFLWAVQTGIIAYASSRRRADPDRQKVAEYSGTGVYIIMDEAVRAAGLIPDDKDASTAAAEFVLFWQDREKPGRSPSWFQRYGTEHHDYSHLSKAEQFLWIVQSVIVSDQENQATYDAIGKKPDRYSASRALVAGQAAILSAEEIPNNVSVTDAANEFTAYFVTGERKKAPSWCKALAAI